MITTYNKLKLCLNCKVEKSFKEFYRNKNSKDGLDSRCKNCKNKYQKSLKFNLNKNKIKLIGIYKITSPSNKIYIGQSTDINFRWDSYKRLTNCKGQPKLYNSFLKYGVENHKFEIIEECQVELILGREKHWIEFFNSINKGLNCRVDGKGGYDSEETKKKKKECHIGRIYKKRSKFSKEHCEKISKSKKGKSIENVKRKIGKYNLNGDFLEKYESVNDAIRKMNCKSRAIQNCCCKNDPSNEYYKNKSKLEFGKFTSYGYIWKYID